MDNENNYNYDNQDPSSNDYGGNYHYDYNFDLNQEKIPPSYPQPNGFASAALVLGILSLVLSCCFYVSVPLGALGILFAVLSKRDSQMSGRGKAGLGLSIVGLCLALLMGVSLFFTMVRDDSFWIRFEDQLKDSMEYYQDEDYDDLERFFREYEEYFHPGNGQGIDTPDFSDDTI